MEDVQESFPNRPGFLGGRGEGITLKKMTSLRYAEEIEQSNTSMMWRAALMQMLSICSQWLCWKQKQHQKKAEEFKIHN